MSLVKYRPVTLDQVLCHLMARTNTSSTMGAMLDKAQAVYTVYPEFSDTANEMHVKQARSDLSKIQESAEAEAVNGAVYRCVDMLATVKHAHVLKDRPSLAKLQKHVPDRGQGELVIQCLRVYEEWRLRSDEKALAAVYSWAQSHAPLAYPVALHEEETLAQAFRTGAAKRARQRASELYADCYLVLASWVTYWNNLESGKK